ncbi:MAG: Wzz/FepE/Etk N-terminal domain-containing protein [Bacillota bacterium]|nr:Wzz/FepE/Etk N-terminal domain-containing protein [Bacillota bacterium]
MELDIRQIFFMILKKAPIIIASTIIVGFLALIFTKIFVTPLYTSTASLYVQANEKRQTAGAISTADYTVSGELVSTITYLIKTDAIINEVAESSNLRDVYDNNHLRDMVSVSSSGTEHFKVKVNSSNPEHALILVNAFSRVISDSTLINNKIINSDDPNRGYIRAILGTGNITLIDEGTLPVKPSSPNVVSNTLIGILLGFILSILCITGYEKVNLKIITEDDLTSLFADLPVIGSIPLIEDGPAEEKGGQ